MNADRRSGVVTGIVFIIATAGSVASTAFLPDLAASDYLPALAANAERFDLAVICLLIAAFGSAGIAPAMYPVLRRSHPGLAIASVVFRTIEAALYIVAALCLLSLLSVGREVAAAGSASLPLQALGSLLLASRNHAALAGVFAFCLGAFAYYWLFWTSRLVPLWLSGFGIVAILLMFTACLLALFSDAPITGYIPLALPIAIQEMVLAVWLIVRGFSPAVIKAMGTPTAAD